MSERSSSKKWFKTAGFAGLRRFEHGASLQNRGFLKVVGTIETFWSHGVRKGPSWVPFLSVVLTAPRPKRKHDTTYGNDPKSKAMPMPPLDNSHTAGVVAFWGSHFRLLVGR